MENAVKALEMAFAVIVFIIALSVSMYAFNNAKKTSDIMLYAQDKTNYYEYQGAKGKTAEDRIVGIETIVPTVYKYYKENYTVLFRKGNYNTQTGELSNLEYLKVYDTPSKSKSSANGVVLWGTGNTYDALMQNKYAQFFDGGYTKSLNKEIFSFDLEEETLRHEPWTGSYEKERENLDKFFSGEIYKNPNNQKDYINYKYANGKSFIEEYKNSQFLETIGEYAYNSTQSNTNNSTEDGSSISSLVKQKKKRIIIFTLIN